MEEPNCLLFSTKGTVRKVDISTQGLEQIASGTSGMSSECSWLREVLAACLQISPHWYLEPVFHQRLMVTQEGVRSTTITTLLELPYLEVASKGYQRSPALRMGHWGACPACLGTPCRHLPSLGSATGILLHQQRASSILVNGESERRAVFWTTLYIPCSPFESAMSIEYLPLSFS